MEYKIENINNYTDKDINNFYPKLYKLKKEKISKYKHNNKKKISIIGDMLLCELLKRKNINYDNLDFYINYYGKPYIKNSNLFFNISHSFNYVITILSNKEIGVDIEKIRKTPLNAINQFATEKEKQYILSSNIDVEKRIFQIYTLKEAYFKMKGTNLNDILKIEFIITDNKIYCNDKSIKAGFINDVKGYIIAYCER